MDKRKLYLGEIGNQEIQISLQMNTSKFLFSLKCEDVELLLRQRTQGHMKIWNKH